MSAAFTHTIADDLHLAVAHEPLENYLLCQPIPSVSGHHTPFLWCVAIP